MAVDRRVIGGAVAAGVVIAATMIWSANDASTPTAVAPRAQARDPRIAAHDQAAPDVNLDALRGAREQPVDQGRNPFRFRPKPAPPAPPPVQPPSLFGGASNQGGTGPIAPPGPTGPPPPPPIPLKLIGIVKQGDKTIAVVTDGQSPAHAVDGGQVYGRYRILKVGLDSVEIAYEDGRGRTTLRLPPQ